MSNPISPERLRPFFAAVSADKQKDHPRRVYADLLDDHGHADTATFIRNQLDAALAGGRCQQMYPAGACKDCTFCRVWKHNEFLVGKRLVSWVYLAPWIDLFRRDGRPPITEAGSFNVERGPVSVRLEVRLVPSLTAAVMYLERGVVKRVYVHDGDWFVANGDETLAYSPVEEVEFSTPPSVHESSRRDERSRMTFLDYMLGSGEKFSKVTIAVSDTEAATPSYTSRNYLGEATEKLLAHRFPGVRFIHRSLVQQVEERARRARGEIEANLDREVERAMTDPDDRSIRGIDYWMRRPGFSR